jgi:1-deoxy-D-xylulose-5-phosphate reductoisomerase
MINLCILGATGSIGQSTLDVVRLHPDRFHVSALSANRNIDLLVEQIQEFQPQSVALADSGLLNQLEEKLIAKNLHHQVEVYAGQAGLVEVAQDPQSQTVVAGIVGAAGLLPTMAAVQAGKRVLLANKEALVCAGGLFMSAVESSGAELLPLDSEHNAIFQCMPAGQKPNASCRRILLTASGGPFRGFSKSQLGEVTPEQAFKHPNWDMGKKISVDSATMMNKGLELIEARWLFDVPVEKIEILVHPESIVHSLVEYDDGSQLAQLGTPDMRTPIANALGYPDRILSGTSYLDLTGHTLHFEEPDLDTFRCLSLAIEAAKNGGSFPLFLNAANEEAVSAFIEGKIRFTDIADLVEKTLKFATAREPASIDEVIELDGIARQHCLAHLEDMLNANN